MFTRLASLLGMTFLAALSVSAQYKMEPIANPAPDLPAAYTSLMQKQGYRVVGPSGPYCEIWFRNSLPAGPKSAEDAVAFPTVPFGSLLGVLRFAGTGADRRGQSIKAGVYTLRYGLYPVNGDHQGVAPQRDFAVLTPISQDADPSATPAFEPLVAMSRKASGTPHPAVLSLETPPGATFPSFGKEGEKDWTLSFKIGDMPMAIILVGKAEG